MNILRRILTGTALALALSSVAAADTLVVTTSVASTQTDITDTALAITPFTPGSNGVPLGSVLTGFTVTFAESIAGTVMLTNNGPSSATLKANVDTIGLIYLFTSAATHGDTPIDPTNPPADDVFAGAGPDAAGTQVKSTVAKGGTSGALSYTSSSASATSSLDTNAADLILAQSAWNAYLSTATLVSTTGSSSVGITLTNNVSGLVTVTYDYSSSPEPATMVLFGTALVGLGLIRKRILK